MQSLSSTKILAVTNLSTFLGKKEKKLTLGMYEG